jgi:magnesium transporter
VKGELAVKRALLWRDGQLKTDDSAQSIQNALQDPTAVIWLDLLIDLDSEKYMHVLRDVLKLSHLTLESIVEEHERSKLTQGNGYFYLVTHGLGFDTTTGESSTPKLDIVFGKNFLVTVHQSTMPWLDNMYEGIRTDEDEQNLIGRGTAYLLYTVIDALVDSYFPVLDTLDDIIDELEVSTVNDASNAVQARIFRIKRSLAQMRRVISPQVEVANSLVTRTGEYIPTEVEPYFAEVHDHLIRTFEVLDSYRDLMSGLLDVYLTTVSNRLNQVMKQLTIIATIFMPITFVTGVFGQNFLHLPQVEYDRYLNFWTVLAFMAIITVLQIWYFKYRKWI